MLRAARLLRRDLPQWCDGHCLCPEWRDETSRRSERAAHILTSHCWHPFSCSFNFSVPRPPTFHYYSISLSPTTLRSYNVRDARQEERARLQGPIDLGRQSRQRHHELYGIRPQVSLAGRRKT